MKIDTRSYIVTCAAAAMRHRIAAVILDAIGESGARPKAIAKVSGAPLAVVLAVLTGKDGPIIHDIVRVALACGVRLNIDFAPRQMPTRKADQS